MDCDRTGGPSSAGRARLAVLIDAGNASPRNATAVFEAAAKLGEASVRRIYSDFSNGQLVRWDAVIRSWAIVAHYQPSHARGRNAADIALAVDAMDLMYRRNLDGFVPVGSDSDLTRLAQRLREGGLAVYGFGESKTPRAFRAACHRCGIVGKVRNGARGPSRN